MSLVYEALRKAERERERKTGHVSPPPPASAEPRLTQSPAANVAVHAAISPVHAGEAPAIPDIGKRTALGLIIVAAVLAIAATAVWFYATTKRHSGSAKVPEIAPAAVRLEPALAQTAVPAAPAATATENDPRFKLTGIMIMGDSYGAVINGHIVYDGHYVDGAIVKKVERDRVTLDWNGREILLRLF